MEQNILNTLSEVDEYFTNGLYDDCENSNCFVPVSNLTNHNLEMTVSDNERAKESLNLEETSTEVENKLMSACKKGDVITAKSVLEMQIASLDYFDSMGFTPLMHAIKNGQEELVNVLLSDQRIRQDDCLLAAVDSGNCSITRLLIEYGIDPNQEAKLPVFGHGATPLILACIINNVELIRLLLDKNATPLALEPEIRGTTLFDCRRRIKLLQALSSPAYIALTSTDPVGTCFKLSKQSRWLGNCENELAEDYYAISDHCEGLAAGFVNAVEESFDVMTLLSMKTDPETGICGLGEPLCRLKEALTGQHKKFIAHSHCQLALADEFIKGIKSWRHLESALKFRLILLMIVFTPIWAIFCIILPPNCKISKYLKVPFMKFIANITTYLVIILLTISEQVNLLQPDDKVLSLPGFSHGSPFRWREIVCLLWLLGRIIQETQNLFSQGLNQYLCSTWKVMDLLICTVFSIAFTARTIDAFDWLKLKDNLPDRQQWTSHDPLLVYEASLCIGTLLSVNRILNYFKAHRQLGKLQMSLGASFGEIAKFMALFVVMYLSFAAAINALYWKDQVTAVDACYNEINNQKTSPIMTNFSVNKTLKTFNENQVVEKCPIYVRKRYEKDEFQFQTLGGCLYQLYWTLFGYSNIVFASKVYQHWTLHTLVGSCLFIMFNFLAVVVLLNVLIGMITKVLDNIEANIDVEWKFARSSIYAEFINDSYCLPPPFNIVPSTQQFLNILAIISKVCSIKSPKHKLIVHYAKPYKMENLKRKRKQQDKFEQILKSMKNQYLRNEQKESEKEQVTIDLVEALRNDVSGLKFEILSFVRPVPTTLSDMTIRQFEILKDLSNVQNQQKHHESQFLDHSKQINSFHSQQMNQLTCMDENQQNEFQKVKSENEKSIKQATDFQTQQSNECDRLATERMTKAKEEQLLKVELIHQKQDLYFNELKSEQQNLLSRQQIESTKFHEELKFILEKLQRQDAQIEELSRENRENAQRQTLDKIAEEKRYQEMEAKFTNKLEQLTSSYEQTLESITNQQSLMMENQEKLMEKLLNDTQNKIMENAKLESDRIIQTSGGSALTLHRRTPLQGRSATKIPTLSRRSNLEGTFGSTLELGASRTDVRQFSDSTTKVTPGSSSSSSRRSSVSSVKPKWV
ncbi:short transient receptor potential channel 7-like [Convolutriloba macropyga]|uniref:short transient receptor potential channel 7-like n=1 Tax=Convolutriloba macropyga TaxID=536237 RepID=UPI003F51C269